MSAIADFGFDIDIHNDQPTQNQLAWARTETRRRNQSRRRERTPRGAPSPIGTSFPNWPRGLKLLFVCKVADCAARESEAIGPGFSGITEALG